MQMGTLKVSLDNLFEFPLKYYNTCMELPSFQVIVQKYRQNKQMSNLHFRIVLY